MIPIARPLIGEEEKQVVLAVLESGMLAQGERVKAFEEAFARFCGVKYAIATSSGTTALHLALLAHGIGPGDEVITSPFSFIATANAIHYVGAKPVFADIEFDTFNLDPAQVAKRITPRTRAVMPVHLFGHPADMDKFMDIARRHHLVLIEDACQAHGAEYRGRRAGSFGTGCFSFYPTKNITSGEGGMVTTDDATIADRVQLLRNHGMRQRYYHEIVGYNYRMTDIHAAIGLAQLGKLERFNRARIANAYFLTSRLPEGVVLPKVRPEARHVFHQYTVRVPRGRDRLMERLIASGVGAVVYYPLAIHRQKPYQAGESYPVSEAACEQVLSLPVHPGLSPADLETIVAEVNKGIG
jgi:dTDP-4-amino-4,6-dideoxygalactose transaminase